MENFNDSAQFGSTKETDADYSRKLAIALTKKIQSEAETIEQLLQTNEKERQMQLKNEQKLGIIISEKEAEVKALKNEVSKFKEKQLRGIGEVKALKGQLSKNTSDFEATVKTLQDELSRKINKEIQIRKIAKRYKESYFKLKAEAEGSRVVHNPPKNELTDETVDKCEVVSSLTNENVQNFTELSESYEKKLLEENRSRIAALSEINQNTSETTDIGVAEVLKYWKELDTKLQEIIDQNMKQTERSDIALEKGSKRQQDDEDDCEITQNKLARVDNAGD